MEAYLILEDGRTFAGTSVGYPGEVISEIVFNTSMSGYLEILTDPSYAGQAITMTYPLIGNYGVSRTDLESLRPEADAFIVRELSRIPSNWRSENTIQNFLRINRIPGLAGIDTRALTRHLRDHGTMNGCLTTRAYAGKEREQLLARIRNYRVRGVVEQVSTGSIYTMPALGERRRSVAVIDLGVKQSILWSLLRRGCEVTVFPAGSTAEEILSAGPDGILVSNGPGDPKENTGVIRTLRRLMDADIPIFAICLGHQLMALAAGGDTYKLKFGHRGSNHPVKDLATGRVYISAQNHGYAVRAESLDPAVAVESFRNANDGTNEGLHFPGRRIETVQFHPEARPGPNDTAFLFDRFIERMEAAHA